jgi:hypothetical protein
MFYDNTTAEIEMFPDVYKITDELGQEEWWRVRWANCVISGECITVRLTLTQISAMC